MTKRELVAWGLLALTRVHRHTWGSCDCDALRRRLAITQREAHAWEDIARDYYRRFGSRHV